MKKFFYTFRLYLPILLIVALLVVLNLTALSAKAASEDTVTVNIYDQKGVNLLGSFSLSETPVSRLSLVVTLEGLTVTSGTTGEVVKWSSPVAFSGFSSRCFADEPDFFKGNSVSFLSNSSCSLALFLIPQTVPSDTSTTSGIWVLPEIFDESNFSGSFFIPFHSFYSDFCEFVASSLFLNFVAPGSSDILCVYSPHTGWSDPHYRIIDFGPDPVEIDTKFFDWLTEYAVHADTFAYQLNGLFALNETLNLPAFEISSVLSNAETVGDHALAGIRVTSNDVFFIKPDGSEWHVYNSSSGWINCYTDLDRFVRFSYPTSFFSDELYYWWLANSTHNSEDVSFKALHFDFTVDDNVVFEVSLAGYNPEFSAATMIVGDDGLITFEYFGCQASYQVSGAGEFLGLNGKYLPGETYALNPASNSDSYSFSFTSQFFDGEYSSAPTISISNDQLHIQYSGDDVTIWAIYVDGELAKTLNSTGASTWFDLSELSLDPGTYSITVAGGVSQTILTGTSAAVSYVVPSTDSIIKPGTWQAKKLVMTGEYSSLSAWPSSLDTVSFNFDTGDSSFSSMKYAAALAGGNYLHYGDTAVYYYGPLSDNVGWVADSYASISVSSAQQVPAEFYNWFIQNFEFVGEDPVLPEVKTVVNIYDSTGKVLLKTISFSGSTAPEVTLAVTSSGCTLTSGDNVQSWVASSGFYGLSLKAASSSASYSIGGSYVFPGGSSVDHVLSFYVVSERDHDGSGGSFGDGSDGNVSEVGTLFAGFGGFLSTVLSGFLSFQIVPGLSFGGMVEFFIYIGLLVVFIKLIS